MKNPLPSTPPSRQSADTVQSSKNSSAVSWASHPSLSRVLPRRKPGKRVSTRKIDRPLAPPSWSVLATTATMSQIWPLVMKVLAPLMTYWSPCFTARVRMACRSEPVPGSVMATAQITSPEAIFGNHSCFCASVPSARI
ncbi:hypothetical protein D3C76_1125410 [compost metagenome]